jgi:hypothetical protein
MSFSPFSTGKPGRIKGRDYGYMKKVRKEEKKGGEEEKERK